MRSIESSLGEEKAKPSRRWHRVPRSRAVVGDVLYFARAIPTYTHSRECDLSSVRDARAAASTKIAWPILFLRAFALVAEKSPVLRQALIPWPWRHIYQHPESVGTLPVHRHHEEEEWLLFAPFRSPESRTLADLQERLVAVTTQPVDRVMRTQYRCTFVPLLLRRLFIWSWIQWGGAKRARRVGTFGVTTISGRGAVIDQPPGIMTATLTYGPVADEGKARVILTYDHRLMDGWYVADILRQIEETLNTVIADELRAL